MNSQTNSQSIDLVDVLERAHFHLQRFNVIAGDRASGSALDAVTRSIAHLRKLETLAGKNMSAAERSESACAIRELVEAAREYLGVDQGCPALRREGVAQRLSAAISKANAVAHVPARVVVASYEQKQGVNLRVFADEKLARGWQTAIAEQWWNFNLALHPKPDQADIGRDYFDLVEDEFFEVQECEVEGPGSVAEVGSAPEPF